MKISTLTSIIILISTSTVRAEQLDEKAYYQKIKPALRLQLLTQTRAMRFSSPSEVPTEIKSEDDKNNLVQKIDVLKYLSEKCGFDYTRNSAGQPVRPQVECTYTPRAENDGFNGMMSKFDCAFTNKDGQESSKPRVLKVKYDPKKRPGGGYKEVPQAIAGTMLARLIGFYTGTYCPADVVCKDCPSDQPWENGKSKTPAAPGSRVLFENVAVEIKQKGYKIIDSTNTETVSPIGFYFRKELNWLFPSDRALAEKLRAERDALTLWFNFVVSRDAGAYNVKLICLQSDKIDAANPAPKCHLPIGVINDYGNSFGFKNKDQKMSLARFNSPALIASRNGLITSGANGSSEADNHNMSDAGRTLFVQGAESITDAQLADVFQLAQFELTTDASIDKWKSAFKQKIKDVKSARPSFE